jgi:hypothetical protein
MGKCFSKRKIVFSYDDSGVSFESKNHSDHPIVPVLLTNFLE